MSSFAPDTQVVNSPITNISYRRTRRLRFLFAALRTESLMAREELARIATSVQGSTGMGYAQLLAAMHESVDLANLQAPQITQNPRRRRAFIDLAWLVHNQGMTPEDFVTAKHIYQWCIANLGSASPDTGKTGWRGFQQMHLADLAMLAIRLQDQSLAEQALGRLRTTLSWLPRLAPARLKTIRALAVSELTNTAFVFGRDFSLNSKFLKLDAANPFRGQAEPLGLIQSPAAQNWLTKLNRQLLPRQAAPLKFSATAEAQLGQIGPLDLLVAAKPPKPFGSGPLLTVVVSCFQPNAHLVTSVQSILASSYQNLEVLVIDDASGPDFQEVLRLTEALDDRVKLLHQSSNSGTYAIRNRALDEASGELITFNDSDDWMHPQRLELQARRLIKSRRRIGNISMSTRLTENLEAVESGRRLRVGLCEPSLMFWRKKVLLKIGYFDGVRKGGDSEYRQRLQIAFGQELEVIHPFRCLTLQRADNGGLTQGDLGFRWITDYRLAYRDSFRYWHRTNRERLHVPPGKNRQFFAPRQMRFTSDVAQNYREIDVLIGANFCDPLNVKRALPLIKEATARGKSVGLWQLNTMYPLALPRTMRSQILDLLNAGEVTTVYAADHLDVKRLKLIAPSAFMNSYSTQVFNWSVRLLEHDTLEQAREAETETWVASGPGLEQLLSVRVAACFRPDQGQLPQL